MPRRFLVVLAAISAAACLSRPAFVRQTPRTSEVTVRAETPAESGAGLERADEELRSPRALVASAGTPGAPDGPGDVASPPQEQVLTWTGSFDGDLRTLPYEPPDRIERAEHEMPLRAPTLLPGTAEIQEEPSLLAQGLTASAPLPTTNFDGLDFNNWGNGHPPDTNGDVGPNYYIQTINTSIGIFDKVTGTRVAAFTFNTFFKDHQRRSDSVVEHACDRVPMGSGRAAVDFQSGHEAPGGGIDVRVPHRPCRRIDHRFPVRLEVTAGES
jgi:hypothetical protein